MKQVAVFSDVHGNTTAFKAMIADARANGANEYWFLGDLLMPGPGVAEIWRLLQELQPTHLIRGNWDDLVIHGIRGDIDLSRPSHVYFARLAQFVGETLPAGALEKMATWPIAKQIEVGNLKINLSHNLPNLNMGQALFPTNESEKFDQLLVNGADLAIYAHVHHQLFRYGTDERIVLNPGSVGEPFNGQLKLQADMRAQYLLLTFDDQGIADLRFRHVNYQRKHERKLAIQADLPYLELYLRHLKTGRVYTHNQELIHKLNEKYHYKADCEAYRTK